MKISCKVVVCKAGKLHHEEGVAEGPCRRDELKKFQEFLGAEYQVIVFEGPRGTIVFKDKQYDRLRTSLPAESTEPLLPN